MGWLATHKGNTGTVVCVCFAILVVFDVYVFPIPLTRTYLCAGVSAL